MVKISLLSGEESMATEDSQDEQFTALDLLEITQNSAILDLFHDADCVAKIPPYIAEAK